MFRFESRASILFLMWSFASSPAQTALSASPTGVAAQDGHIGSVSPVGVEQSADRRIAKNRDPNVAPFYGDVQFLSGSTTFTPSGQAVLSGLLAKAQRVEVGSIIAVGHADIAEPGAQTLSLRRAEAVKAYFANSGIDASRIFVWGKGAMEPIADNQKEEGRQENRRVEVEIVSSKKQGAK